MPLRGRGFGEEIYAYLLTTSDSYPGLTSAILRSPLTSAVGKFLDECQNDPPPLHVSVSAFEIVRVYYNLSFLARHDFSKKEKQLYSAYRATLKEQGIDILEELNDARHKPTDDHARAHLKTLNLKLRAHFDSFLQHYNNPIRLPGQKGALRKPMQFNMIRITWPMD